LGLYEFKESDAWDFARGHGEAKKKGDELQFLKCPYCKGGSKGADKGTFSINLKTGQFKCLRNSCGITGNMLTLAKDFGFSLGRDVDNYYCDTRNKYRQFKKRQAPIVPKPQALSYLEKRGISATTAGKYQITVRNDNPDILVFPFLDEKGDLQIVKYRNANFNPETDRNKEWAEKGCKPILFGMYQCNPNNKTLVMTEGQIDSLSVAEAGIENAVSVPTGARGFTWVPHCWDWLQSHDALIVFGDWERGEMSLLEEMRRRFNGKVMAVQPEDYRGCKDANELLQKYGKEAVADAVKNARLIPIKQVKELADVKSVDLYSLPRIPTGIARLDEVLSGGIFLGQTVVLTGKRGDGKSTLASQIVANALDEGKCVFAYSGELADYFFKHWIDLQIAGPSYVIDRAGTGGYLTNSTVEKISDWYKGRAYIFDNHSLEDEEPAALLTVLEKSIQQYGIELVLIDNLMSALDVDISVDLYRMQSKFVDKLVKLAKRLNVAVILVAHPRKNKYGSDDTDEVAGSSDITNKVDVVMTYKRGVEATDDNIRFLSVSKNRLTGRLAVGTKEIELFYDPTSKRINDNKERLQRRYSWESDELDFVPIAEGEQMNIPFD